MTKPAMVPADPYGFGPFTLDLQKRRIARNGRLIRSWSPRRFELLKILIEADGAVISYDDLIIRAWGNSNVTFHTITKTANDLKRCLGEYADCVQNQHGVGYFFQRPPTQVSVRVNANLDLDAITEYGLGLEELNRRTESSLQRALVRFRGVATDYPEFVPALLGVADCLTLLGHAGFPVFSPAQVLPEARATVERAIELAADSETRAAAFAALGKIQLMFDWKWSAAEASFEKALSLNARHSPIHHGLAHLFLVTNRWKESLEAIDQARRCSSSSPMLHGTHGWLLYFMGDYERAVGHCQKTVSAYPEFPPGYVMLGLAYEASGLCREALQAFNTSCELQMSPFTLAGLGHVYGSMGRKAAAQRSLRKLRTMNDTHLAMSPYYCALVHASIGEADEAISCLEEAGRNGFDWMIHLCVDPRWRVLYKHRRFKELVKRIGLHEFWRDHF